MPPPNKPCEDQLHTQFVLHIRRKVAGQKKLKMSVHYANQIYATPGSGDIPHQSEL
eukprot:TRINITY_DN4196_c0_g1_i1.p2 TRINITY_DN4196_c0_g1~~TRINITY_DN4196_c0_g1_i1.p2  ORF type:complete len:56 (+),score=6.16 TRINITY_DN4196_c0_g1_i1:55-222(+)